MRKLLLLIISSCFLFLLLSGCDSDKDGIYRSQRFLTFKNMKASLTLSVYLPNENNPYFSDDIWADFRIYYTEFSHETQTGYWIFARTIPETSNHIDSIKKEHAIEWEFTAWNKDRLVVKNNVDVSATQPNDKIPDGLGETLPDVTIDGKTLKITSYLNEENIYIVIAKYEHNDITYRYTQEFKGHPNFPLSFEIFSNMQLV